MGAEHRGKHYVLQADKIVDRHRVVAVVDSGFIAYLVRGQVENLLKAAVDPLSSHHLDFRKIVRMCGLRMPRK